MLRTKIREGRDRTPKPPELSGLRNKIGGMLLPAALIVAMMTIFSLELERFSPFVFRASSLRPLGDLKPRESMPEHKTRVYTWTQKERRREPSGEDYVNNNSNRSEAIARKIFPVSAAEAATTRFGERYQCSHEERVVTCSIYIPYVRR